VKAQDARQVSTSVWQSLSVSERRFVLGALVIGFSQLILVDLYYRIQELPAINQYYAGMQPTILLESGINYPPFVVSGLVCIALLALPIILVTSQTKQGGASAIWLGSAWLLATIVLIVDLMLDTFEIKWPVIILFAYAGLRYWRGVKRDSLSLILAPAIAVISGLDGLHHLSGQDCLQTGLDACPAKAVSDIYLVMMLLVLTYLTTSFVRRPK